MLVFVLLFAAVAFLGRAAAAESVVFACNEFPPYKMENSDTGLPGFDVEFLEEAFKRSGIAIEIVYMPWIRALKEAKDAHVDGVCSCSRTEERDSYLLYSEPLGKASSGLFSLAENDPAQPARLEEVRGKTIGVIRGYNLIENLEKAGIEDFILLSSEQQAARMLLRNRLDYYYGYEAPTRFYLKQLGDAERFRYNEISHREYFSCFSKNVAGSTTLLKRFNEGLKQIKDDGTHQAILEKYR